MTAAGAADGGRMGRSAEAGRRRLAIGALVACVIAVQLTGGEPAAAQNAASDVVAFEAFDLFRAGCLGVDASGAMDEPQATAGFLDAPIRFRELGLIPDGPDAGAFRHAEHEIVADVGDTGAGVVCLVSIWGGDAAELATLLDGSVDGLWRRAVLNGRVGWVSPGQGLRWFISVAPINPDGSAVGFVALPAPG